MTDPLIYFLLGTVFGACFLAAMIVRRYERLAFERGHRCGAWKVGKQRRWEKARSDLIDGVTDTKRCRRVRFGRNGNLMRWEPL